MCTKGSTPHLRHLADCMRPPQLIPGHEAIGKVVEVGKKVKDFQIGDRVVADVGISVNTSFIRFLS